MGRPRRYMLRNVTNNLMTTRAHLQSELASQGVQVSKKTIVRELNRIAFVLTLLAKLLFLQ